MRSRFIAKIFTVAFGLATFLLVDAALAGVLTLLAGLCFIPAGLYLTICFAQLALQPKKRRRVCHSYETAKPACGVMQPTVHAPRLRVVQGGKKPHHAA